MSMSLLKKTAGQKSAMEVLNFLLVSAYLNVWVALRVILTLPMSVASAERSLSKLKLIKTYLRTKLLQDRLNNLAILAIENDMCSAPDRTKLINDFAAMKARKIHVV